MATLNAPNIFRTGDVAAILHPADDDQENISNIAYTRITPEVLRAFGDAIRRKEL
jgi:hypothetical protein